MIREAAAQPADPRGAALRALALSVIALAVAFLADSYLTLAQGWPGASGLLTGGPALAWVQAALYPGLVAVALAWIWRTSAAPLRRDADLLSGLVTFLIRAAFWSVLIVGVTDMLLSFLRVEGFLSLFVGEETTKLIGVPRWRGTFIHMPLMLLAILIALRVRGLGFIWLAALVVVAELVIVLARFIFSYEQAFMGDLVRFWYAALFLFASAQTLVEDGHVRVDVLYAGFSGRAKARTNLFGAALLGIPLCWTVLILGLHSKAAIIASPILAFETTQSGFGLYVKYMMAGFLGVFAVTMLIQFTASLLSAGADLLGEPGGRKPDEPAPMLPV